MTCICIFILYFLNLVISKIYISFKLIIKIQSLEMFKGKPDLETKIRMMESIKFKRKIFKRTRRNQKFYILNPGTIN